MVLYAFVLAFLPLALGGMQMTQQQAMAMQQGWGSNNMGSNNMGSQQQGWGSNSMGVKIEGTVQTQQQNNNNNNMWWGMSSQEEYEAYLKWCEERQMALQEQAQQKALLEEMEARVHEQERAHEHEKAAKEMQVKREAMASQWKMWQAQMEMAEEFDGSLDKFTDMKGHYYFKIVTEFLHLCKCSDYAQHLTRYLQYGEESYESSVADLFAVDGFETVDTNDIDGVARRVATLSQTETVKLYFSGAIYSTCEGMRAYVQQVLAWEAQYNFMG